MAERVAMCLDVIDRAGAHYHAAQQPHEESGVRALKLQVQSMMASTQPKPVAESSAVDEATGASKDEHSDRIASCLNTIDTMTGRTSQMGTCQVWRIRGEFEVARMARSIAVAELPLLSRWLETRHDCYC